jgi:hypothetical protein
MARSLLPRGTMRRRRRVEGTMFKVEHLEPNLIARNGRYGYYGLEIARRGEKKGVWKILEEGHVGGRYETRVLEAGGSGKYLVRAAFKGTKDETATLSRKDLYGDQEAADAIKAKGAELEAEEKREENWKREGGR